MVDLNNNGDSAIQTPSTADLLVEEEGDAATPVSSPTDNLAEEDGLVGEDGSSIHDSNVVEVSVEAKNHENLEPEAGPTFDELSPERSALPWYVVQVYSGQEHRAKANLEEQIRSRGLIKKFGSIVVPQETVVELVKGQKKTSNRKFFPGYILVQAHLDDETWHLVTGTPKISGFIGDSRNPSPISKEEVETLLKQMEGGTQKPRSRVHFEEGDAVKVIDGPFADFNGTVDEVKADKGKLRVLISIFGRNTPVELDFVQVEKA